MPRPPEPPILVAHPVAHVVELPGVGRDQVLAAVEKAAEAWGAGWRRQIDGGRLTLPVVAGMRHGSVAGPLSVETRAGGGCRLSFVPEEASYGLNLTAVVILVLSSLGGLLTVVWPFFPKLLVAAPLGAVIALCGWFLVVSRLHTSGADDFLALVVEEAGGEEPAAGD